MTIKFDFCKNFDYTTIVGDQVYCGVSTRKERAKNPKQAAKLLGRASSLGDPV